MNKIKYLIKRIFHMNFKSMFNKIDGIHKKTNRNKILIFLDMVYCGIKYQAGYMDYELFEMYNLNNEQRKTILTRGKNNAFVKLLNDKNSVYKFDNKVEFNKIFDKYLKRDWLDFNNSSKEDFNSFIKKHPSFMLKPVDGTCGHGIEKIDAKKYKKDELYKYIRTKGNVVLEELIIQNKAIDKMYAGSVNTFRIVSVLKNDNVNVVVAYFRVGNGSFVDNFNSGGMVVPINVKTGIIEYNAIDKSHNIYKCHPITKTKFIGFKIPEWNKIIKLVKEASKLVPEVKLVAWDICLSENGPVIVEGNHFPGHDLYQLPPHRTNGIGVLPEFEKAIYGTKK